MVAAVLCVVGPWTIPIGPVPISLVTLVISLAVYLLGAKLSTASVLVYLLIGAVGLPVFSNYGAGLAKVVGPTGGYLVGYLALAFVGDAVLELLVRARLVGTTRLQPNRLHTVATHYVSAHAQNLELDIIEPMLTDAEAAVLRRGKNASKATVAKHATVQEYRASTGFECLLGWLYLQGRNDRIEELFNAMWDGYKPE